MPDDYAHEPETAAREPHRRPRRAFGLLDRLAVVREHWLAVGVVFSLVFGLILILTLRTMPTYEASASLTIESSSGGLNDDLNIALGKPSKVETEMEVLRSFRMARGAARILIGLEAHPPSAAWARSEEALARIDVELARRRAKLAGTDFTPAEDAPCEPDASLCIIPWFNVLTLEVNAYRPWDVLLRRFIGAPEPVRLQVQTNALPEADAKESYLFEFDASGQGLRVTGTHDGVEASEHLEAVKWDEPFTIRGRTFLLARPSGKTAGHSYDVIVQAPEPYAERIFGGVKVNPVGRYTDMVEIVCSASTPHEAQARATAMAESYLARRQSRQKEEVSVNQAWLAEEVLKYFTLLQPLEADLETYVKKEQAVLLSEQATATLERQLTLTTSVAKLERELIQVEGRLARLKAGKDRELEEISILLGPDGTNAMTPVLFTKYAELKRQLAEELNLGTKAGSRAAKKMQAGIDDLRDEIKAILGRALDQMIADQERAVAGFEKEIGSLNKALEEANDLLKRLPGIERGLTRRQGEVDRTRLLLERYSEELMKLKSAGSANDSVASLIDTARLPTSRKSPSLFRMGLLGLFLGLLAGVGLAFFLDSLDHKVRTPQQLEEGTGLTIYGSIPAHEKLKKKDRSKLQSRLVTVDKPNSVVTEAYRSLRANIRFANKGKSIRTIATTSALPQEGKSTTTCNLGVVLAQAGSRTLIVDADMRRPSTHVHFGGSRTPGLSDVLRDDLSWRDVVSQTHVENLDVLYAGRSVGNPGALLDSSAFASLLEELKDAYDYVLFDVPPALAVADSAAFFQSLDGILLLTHYGRCSVDVVDGAREQIERVGGNVLGAILNAFDVTRTNRRGYGYYGYGGYYGSYGYYSRKDSETDEGDEAAPVREHSKERV